MKPKHLLAAALAAFCQVGLAAPSYYAFSGVIDDNHTEFAGLTTFSGVFSFDPSQPDLAPADPHDGYYPMSGGSYGLSVAFSNGPQFLTDPMASYALGVHVPQATAVDQLPDAGHFDVEGRVQGQIDRFIGLSFRKNFVTDALPGANGVFGLADFDQASFFYEGLPTIAPNPGDPVLPPYGADGHVTALTCIDGCVEVIGPTLVPEPATITLLFAGLAAPGLLIRRRRK